MRGAEAQTQQLSTEHNSSTTVAMPRPKKVTPEMAERARALRREGQSFRRIGAQLRLSAPTVARICASVTAPELLEGEPAKPTEVEIALRALRQAVDAGCRLTVTIEALP